MSAKVTASGPAVAEAQPASSAMIRSRSRLIASEPFQLVQKLECLARRELVGVGRVERVAQGVGLRSGLGLGLRADEEIGLAAARERGVLEHLQVFPRVAD